MRRDTVQFIILGVMLIVALVVMYLAFGRGQIKLRDAEPEETAHVTEVELETYTTTRMNTEKMHDSEMSVTTDNITKATQSGIENEGTEECATTGAVTETAPEPAETRYLNVSPGDGYLDVPMTREVQDDVRAIADEYGVPFELVMAVCYVESGFDPYAISSHGDAGLMQIAPVNHGWVASDLGCVNLYDELQNVRAGTHILADKIAGSGGDYTIALMKYNRGDVVALQQMSEGIFSTDYTEKVLGKYYEYLTYGG